MNKKELKKTMNSMYGRKNTQHVRNHVNSSCILKTHYYRIEIRRDQMDKEEIDEIIKNLHNKCYLEYQYVLRCPFRKVHNCDELKSKQHKMYYRNMNKSHIVLSVSGTKQDDSVKTILNMISKYGDKFLRTINLDSDSKAINKAVTMSIPCAIFNKSLYDIFTDSAIGENTYNKCVELLPETLIIDFNYEMYIPIVES